MNDLISRQAAMRIFEEHCYPVRIHRYDHNSIERGMTLTGIVEVLNMTPPAQPTGHWIEDETSNHVEKTFLCSECGFSAWGQYEKTKFCGGCEAKMENPYEEFN